MPLLIVDTPATLFMAGYAVVDTEEESPDTPDTPEDTTDTPSDTTDTSA